jgi:peptidoglycan hydrolase CwlO-like protein
MPVQILNLREGPAQEPEAPDPVVDEFNETRELIDQTRSDVRRVRTQLERQQEQHDSHAQRTKVLSIILGLLIVILAGTLWYAYPILRDENKAVAGLFSLQNLTTTLGHRVNSVEANLDKISGGLPAVANKVDELQANMKTNLQAARNQARAVATQVGQRIREDVNKSIQLIQSQLASLESNQVEAAERVSQLEKQVAGLQREVATFHDEASVATEKVVQLAQAQQTTTGELAGLNERIAGSQTALNSVTNRLERETIEFELTKGGSTQIAPDVSFSVKRIDAKNQELDGTLEFGAETKTLAIRGQRLHMPITFYLPGDTRPLELVLTQISKDAISGYLIKPAGVKAAAQ